MSHITDLIKTMTPEEREEARSTLARYHLDARAQLDPPLRDLLAQIDMYGFRVVGVRHGSYELKRPYGPSGTPFAGYYQLNVTFDCIAGPRDE